MTTATRTNSERITDIRDRMTRRAQRIELLRSEVRWCPAPDVRESLRHLLGELASEHAADEVELHFWQDHDDAELD